MAIYSRVRQFDEHSRGDACAIALARAEAWGGLGKATRGGTDERLGSWRRGRARGQEEKKPNAINARSATGFPWARGDES